MPSFPKLIESLATNFSGGWPSPAKLDEGRSPKLLPRMPPRTQRRNSAYLNPLNERPAAQIGLAIYLGGSVERRFRPADPTGRFRAQPQQLGAAESKGPNLAASSTLKKGFVRSNG